VVVDLLERLLAAAQRGATLGEIVARSRASDASVWYDVSWLLKYGLLRLMD
jgi:hypothetical protein